MRLVVRCAISTALATALAFTFAACSSTRATDLRTDGGDSGSGGHAGTSTGAGGHAPPLGAGGGQSGGAAAQMCAADAGSSACRSCLAKSCCSDFTDCLNTSVCNKALHTHEVCYAMPGADPSACFGDFTRAVEGDGGPFPPVGACIVMSCNAVCGGPQPV